MNQLYTGEITACYLNISKQNKEYAVGYISLADENGTFQTYKFLCFKNSVVQKIKDISPENIKGKTAGLIGVFAQNTYNGNTEYQLTVNDIEFTRPEAEESVPTEANTTSPQGGIPSPVSDINIPDIPTF